MQLVPASTASVQPHGRIAPEAIMDPGQDENKAQKNREIIRSATYSRYSRAEVEAKIAEMPRVLELCWAAELMTWTMSV
jgi:hypothetical protein